MIVFPGTLPKPTSGAPIGQTPACPAGYYVLVNAGAYNGFCGLISINFECSGTDGKPAWGISIGWAPPPYGTGGENVGAGTSNYDPYGTITGGMSWPSGDLAAASAYAQANYIQQCGASSSQSSGGGATSGTSTGQQPTSTTTQPPSTTTQPTGESCPPPPCPAPYVYQESSSTVTTTTSFPTLNCPLVVGGRLPTVGSIEWCACVESVKNWLDQIGQWFVSNTGGISGISSGNGIVVAFSNIVSSLSGKTIPFPPLGDMAGNTKDQLSGYVSQLSSALEQFAIVAGSELIGLTLCRSLLRLLKHARIGWDIGIWATIDLEIVVEPLERLLSYVENYAFQWEVPGVGDAIDCILQQTAPIPQCYCWMECNGANPTIYLPIIDARREKLHDQELIEWARRHDMDDTVIVTMLQSQGWFRQPEAQARVELSYELPTISDHLHWLQRNVFDSQYVTDYFLLDGFDTQANIQAMPPFAGYVVGPDAPQRNFWDAFGHDLHALGMRKEYAAYHYAAHWINPSIGQLAEMMQRLRPGRVDQSIQFTPRDFERVIAEQDVAPYFRKRIEAIAYRTLPIRQLTSSVKHGLFDEAELAERWQDIGYTPSDAVRLAKAMMVDAVRQETSAAHGFTPSVVAKLYPAGLISDKDAHDYLSPQGYSPQEIDTLLTVSVLEEKARQQASTGKKSVDAYAALAIKAYGDGVVTDLVALAALQSAGYTDEAASLELRTIDLRNQMERIDAAVKVIHKAFLRGEVNSQQAHAALITAGVLDPSASNRVSSWQLEMTVPRQAATTAVIIRWAKEGIISIANAEQRLLNIGWSQGDVDIQILELEQTIQQAQAKAAANKARLLAEAVAAADRAKATAQKGLCRLFTPSKMVLWYSERIVDDAKFNYRLKLCGYDQSAIDDLLKQAKVALAAKDAKAAKKGPAGIEYTGPGAVSGGPSAS